MQIKINEAAKLTGVTVRTLHYYDQIGLLRPETVTDTGYRLYGEKDLEIFVDNSGNFLSVLVSWALF
mgnify:CR=1 FL=1